MHFPEYIYIFPLTRGNHKGYFVERYHSYLNKTQTIAGQGRVTHLSIIQNAKTLEYAWNTARIGNMDIPRSLVAVGCEFWFPLDIEISGIPKIIDVKGTTLYNYYHGVSADSNYYTSVVQVLVKERGENQKKRNQNFRSEIFSKLMSKSIQI